MGDPHGGPPRTGVCSFGSKIGGPRYGGPPWGTPTNRCLLIWIQNRWPEIWGTPTPHPIVKGPLPPGCNIHQDSIVDDASVQLSQTMEMEGNVGKGKQGFNLEICSAAILGLPSSSADKVSLADGEAEAHIAEQKQYGLFQSRFANLKTTYMSVHK